jgi:hypothetical protein
MNLALNLRKSFDMCWVSPGNDSGGGSRLIYEPCYGSDVVAVKCRCRPLGRFTGCQPLLQPGIAAACFTHASICASLRSSSWMSIQRASLPVPPGGTGRSDVPRKNVTLT